MNLFFVEKLEVENYFKIFEQEQRIGLAKTAKNHQFRVRNKRL